MTCFWISFWSSSCWASVSAGLKRSRSRLRPLPEDCCCPCWGRLSFLGFFSILAPAFATSTFWVPLLMRSRFLAGLRSNWLRSILPTTFSAGEPSGCSAPCSGSPCGADSGPAAGTSGSAAGSGSGSSCGSGCTGAGSGCGAGSGAGSGTTGFSGSGCGAGSGSGAGFSGSGSGSGSGCGAGSAGFGAGSAGFGAGCGAASFLALMKVLDLMMVSRSGSSSSGSSRAGRRPLFSRISVILTSTLSAACFISRSLPNCFISAGRCSSETFALGLASTSTPCLWRNSTRSSRPMLNCLRSLLILISAILSSLRILL